MTARRRTGGLWAALLCVALAGWYPKSSAQAVTAHGQAAQDDSFAGEPPDDFYAGSYLIVGQKPAGGPAYKGSARLEITDHKIRLSRTFNGRSTVVHGRFVPGGETKKKCLEFEWKDSRGSAQMFCQYSVDFDNYPRLSCVWSQGRNSKGELAGLESYYPAKGRLKK